MQNGFVKIWRKMLKNPVVMKDPEHFIVWVYLLLNATHTNIRMNFNGRVISLKPGQLITGRDKISQETHVDRSKVERILKALENEHQIEQQTTTRGRLITIISWKDYQQIEQRNEQQLSNERATTEQQLSTNKNVRMKEYKHPPSPRRKKNEQDVTDFEKFWDAYPKKWGKREASEAFSKARESGKLPDVQELIRAIESQLQTSDWNKENGRYIPRPFNWLTDERWKDQPVATSHSNPYQFPL